MGLLYKSRPESFTFQHWAGVRLYTTFCNLAESCVFSKQSPLSLCLTTLIVALLIPKIRSHLAEFLRRRSLVSLSILYKPTRVSFGTVLITITYNVVYPNKFCIRPSQPRCLVTIACPSLQLKRSRPVASPLRPHITPYPQP